MYLNLGSAVLCNNSTATRPEDICQTVYDINIACCPGCGSRSHTRLSQWVEIDHPYVRPPERSSRRHEWTPARPHPSLTDIFGGAWTQRKPLQLTTVVARSTNDGSRDLAQPTT